MNIFAGARRLAVVVAASVAMGGIAHVALSTPYASISLGVYAPNGPAQQIDDCDVYSDNAIEFITIQTSGGKDVRAEICFMASRSDEGNLLIPYRSLMMSGRVMMNEKYSDDVRQYTKDYAAAFKPSPQILAIAEKAYSKAFWDQLVDTAKVVGASLLGLLIMTAVVGWVVRGFMGIPTGSDVRPPKQAPESPL